MMLLALLVASAFLGLMAGPAGPISTEDLPGMNFATFLSIILGDGGSVNPVHRLIIMDIRLPRVLMGGLIGASLAVAGVAMQGMFRNPMADPFIVGVSAGAGLGAAMSILMDISLMGMLGVSTSVVPQNYSLPIMAFLGALGTLFVVYNMAKVGGRVDVKTLLLAGIAIGSFLSAVTALMMYVSGDEMKLLVFWMMGGLENSTWDFVGIMAPVTAIGITVMFVLSKDLNAILFGEDTATHLGIDVVNLKRILFVMVALLAGISVAFAGIIGFVGLIIPHMVRLVVGPNHRILIPASTLGGAAFLILADTGARSLAAPAELPVGIITALCGAPYFMYLLRRRKL